MPKVIENKLPKNPNFYNFAERVKEKVESVYECLPEEAIMYFCRKSDLGDIEKKGLFRGLEKHRGCVFIRREETDYIPKSDLFSDDPGLGDSFRKDMFSFRDNLKRLQRSVRSAVADMAQDVITGLRKTADLAGYIQKHEGELPIMLLINGNRIKMERLDERKNAERLSSVSFDRCNPQEIIGAISLDGNDLKLLAENISRGLDAEKAIKAAFVNKVVNWLSKSFTEIPKKEKNIFTPQIISEEEWRKEYEYEFSSEILSDALDYARDITSGSEMFLLPLGGLKKGEITGDIAGFAENYLQEVRNHREFHNLASKLPENEKKILENFPTHSYGSGASIKMGKFLFGKEVQKTVEEKRRDSQVETLIQFGSADDVELAMLAGVEKIYLVDPMLQEKKVVANMLKRIQNNYDQNIILSEDEKEFQFSFAGKKFRVKIFPVSMEEFNDAVGEKGDVVMIFNKVPWMTTNEARKALREDGLYFDNRQ